MTTRYSELGHALETLSLSRRQAVWLFGASVGASGLGALQGCAKSPVTGQKILVGMSESQERSIDAQVAPHQFSQDLGAVQDGPVNAYVSDLGRRLHSQSHRPDMPYSYRVLNANYVNAYTFPGGAMGVTRGILVKMQDEAELAALLGHEIGHVNARHAAQRSGQGMLANVAMVGLGSAVGGESWGDFAMLGGQIGASALLSSYSRDHEREADALGQEYMVRANYPASGMTRLHRILLAESKDKPGVLATMFSSHPLSSERVATAEQLVKSRYASTESRAVQRERFMDQTTPVRSLVPTIEACQRGEMAMSAKRVDQARDHFSAALSKGPRDYASHVLMARCLQAMGRAQEAQAFVRTAQGIYPQEAQAQKLAGTLALQLKQPQAAYEHLTRYEQQLPGDPGIVFLRGVSLEGMGQKQQAAQMYSRYLQTNQTGDASQFAYSRLKAWGLVK